MNTLQGLFLGVVQGLTEFLPISSSGHLVLFQRLFGISKGVLTFDIAVHLATLTSVIAVFYKDIITILKKPFGKLPLLIVTATIPTAIIGLAFSSIIDKLFESGVTLGIEFLITGAIILFAESAGNKHKKLDKMNYLDAAIIGTAQGLAILPAVSRSGLTIAGALARGLDREFAAKFSFLVAIPAILGATAKDILGVFKDGSFKTGIDPLVMAGGMIAAAISGYFAVKFMLKILTKGSMKIFAYYVFVLGGLVLIDQLFFGKFFVKLF